MVCFAIDLSVLYKYYLSSLKYLYLNFMYTPYFSITPQIISDIEEIGRVVGYLQALKIPREYQQEYIKKVAAETVHASTAIEGNTLTQDQVSQLQAGKRVKAIERDVREAQNYFKTLEYIQDVSGHMDAFTQQTILELHQKLLHGVDDTIAGKYRTGQVRVGDYIPPEGWQVKSLMTDFIEWLNTPTPPGYSPVLYAGVAHYQLVAIHPFQDGNGRTTRALVTLYLVKNGYDITQSFALESYYNRERDKYYLALGSADRNRTEDGQPDLTYWLEYFVRGFLAEAQRAKSIIDEFMASRAQHQKTHITKTQLQLLEITADQGTVAMADYLSQVSISQKGVYNALLGLIDLGFVDKQGERKGTRYSITDEGRSYLKS